MGEDSDVEAWAPATFVAVVGIRRAGDVKLGSGGIDGVNGRDRVNAIVAYAN